MKKYLNISLVLMAAVLIFAGCQKEDESGKNYGPVKVTKVFRNTTTSTDKEITEARIGTMIRLEGENFMGITKITCNGVEAYVNPNYRLEKSVIFRIPSQDSEKNETPTGSDCEESVRDKIIISSNGNADYAYEFHILGAAPTITDLSHTLPNTGSWVTVTGTNLKDITKVYFYNDLDNAVMATDQIRAQDPNGKSFQFQVPEFEEGYEGGYIVAEGSGGLAASPNYWYRQTMIFLSKFYSEPDDGLYTYNPNYTNTSYYAWGSGTTGNLPDLETYPEIPEIFPAEGDGPKNPSIFRAMPVPGTPVPVIDLVDGEHTADGGSCIARACFNSDACSGRALGFASTMASGVQLFTTATANENLAFQFDYFIETEWNSGRIAVTFIDNGIKWMANYHPWTEDMTPFKGGAKGGMKEWRTATIPLSDFPNFSGQTYNFVLKNACKNSGNGDYATQGMIAFYNDECDGNPAHEMDDFVLYWNNLRVVPMETPSVGDDEEEE